MSDKPADAVRAACVDVLGYAPKNMTIHCILAAVREKYPPAQCGYFVHKIFDCYDVSCNDLSQQSEECIRFLAQILCCFVGAGSGSGGPRSFIRSSAAYFLLSLHAQNAPRAIAEFCRWKPG